MPSTAEDRDEILQLLYRYNHAIDSGDADGWADTFTFDAVFEVGGQVIAGRDALIAFASNVRGLRHVVVNPVVAIVGDAATVRAYGLALQGTEISVVGSYEDDVTRTPAGWRFAKRVFTFDAPG